MPKFSFIISTFNESLTYLDASIKSCLNQTFSDFDIILINDGGNFIENLWGDKRVRIYNREFNSGLATCLNFAASVSQSEWLIRLDTDDVSTLDRLSVIHKYSSVFPEAESFVSNYFVIGVNGLSLRKINVVGKSLCDNNPFCHGTLAVKRSKFFEVGGYNELLETTQDYELYFRLDRSGNGITIIEDYLYKWRVHLNQVSTNKVGTQMLNTIIIKEFYCKYTSLNNFSEFYVCRKKNVKISKINILYRRIKVIIKNYLIIYATKI